LGEGRVGVAAVVLADCDGGVDIFEEGKRRLVYNKVVASFPLSDGVIEKFCCGSGDKIPSKC